MASPDPSSWLVSADRGGTFTDCHAVDSEGREHRCKVLSSGRLRTLIVDRIDERTLKLRDDWGAADGLFANFSVDWETGGALVESWNAAQRILKLSAPVPDDVRIIDLHSNEAAPVVGARILTTTPLGATFPLLEFRLATTLATNALLEGKTSPVVFFVTKGFGDLLEIGDQRRPDLFALQHHKRRALAEKVVEVAERLDAEGNIILPLPESGLMESATQLVAAGYRTAAVALAHSYRNPAHEQTVATILRNAGFTSISLSSELSPVIRLLPRAETAVVNAALSPVMDEFVNRVREPFGTSARQFYCLSSAGGLAKPSQFRAKDSLLSGPAGGVAGCAAVARSVGAKKILTLDMGGTSTDVARWEGDFLYQFEQRVGSASILAPALRIETVAAGGGSICQIKADGLSVGPESAGADPGPACYGRGGPLTLTDVNLLLGRLDAETAAVPLWIDHSKVKLDELKAEMQQLGWQIPGDLELLQGLLDIAIERMAEAVRRISVREGCDPADYTLVAFGGAGPQHACAIAERLGIQEILVPHHAGLLSAFGASKALEEALEQRQLLMIWTGNSVAALQQTLSEMEPTAMASLPGSSIRRRLAEVRLKGQDTTLLLDFTEAAEIPERFQAAYHALYSYPPPATRMLEIVTLRVIACLPPPEPVLETFRSSNDVTLDPNERSKFRTIQDRFSTMIVESGWDAIQGSLGTWKLTTTQRTPAVADLISKVSPIDAELFRCRFSGIVESMGALLQRTAISTNVKERLDFSCALLDASGRLVMNAPHIPVHLGALGECVRKVTEKFPPQAGQVLVTNDPAHAGSHLPDVTVICPVFASDGSLLGYTANRAHHAEIGGISPGSMPAFAKNLAEEGVLIRPMILSENDVFHEAEISQLLTSGNYPTRNLADNLADLRAQAAAARQGAEALRELAQRTGAETVRHFLRHLCSLAAEAMRRKLASTRFTHAKAVEHLDDGWPIAVSLTAANDQLQIDFTGSGPVHPGSRNATTAVVRSATLYALRLWLAEDISLNEGVLENVVITIPSGFLNPPFSEDPSLSPPVVAGNVETSQRIVDTLLKALQVQACSQGTMNNVIFGSTNYGHYETLCGGSGAGDGYAGADALHTHMTNTAITDAEIIEHRYPVRIEQFSIRKGSGGEGEFHGGNGCIRKYQFLESATISVLTEHRSSRPYGLNGGGEGAAGRQTLTDPRGVEISLPGSTTMTIQPGSILTIETPGGGGFGAGSQA